MSTHVALLTTTPRLDSEAGALCLDMPYSTTGVALFGSNRAWGRTRSGFMARLTAIVAETLLRRAILRNVAHWRD